jgi:integrase
MLALVPIRLKNFAALEIGTSLKLVGRDWWIVLGASDTKEGRPNERRVPKQLAANMTTYLERHRPALARTDTPKAALWLSSNDGRAMSYSAVENTICKVTEATIGIKINPHMFRTAGNSTVAIYASDKPHLGSALLNHRDERTTREHYNRATAHSAQAKWREVLESFEKC